MADWSSIEASCTTPGLTCSLRCLKYGTKPQHQNAERDLLVGPGMDESAPSGKPSSRRSPSLLVVVIVTASLYLAQDVLIPLALAVLVSFLLAPLVRWLGRHRIDRRLSVPGVVLGVAVALGGIATLISSQLMILLERLPEYIESIRLKLGDLSGDSRLFEAFSRMGRLLEIPVSSEDSAEAAPVAVTVVETSQDQVAFLKSVLAPMLAPLATLVLVVIFVFFMLLKWDDLRDRVLRLTGQGHINVTTQALEEASGRLSRYLQMQLLINTLAGLIIGLGLWALGVPNAALWGTIVMLMRFVPYVGPWVAAAGPFLLIFATTEGVQTLLAAGALFILVEAIAVNLIEPWLYGLRTGMSAIGILISFVFWGWLWGPVGLLLATPLSVCLVVAAHHIPQLETLDVLLGDRRPLPSAARLYHRLLAFDPEEGEQIVEDELRLAPTLADFYDRMLCPVLTMAERDRHSESLSDERRRAVYNSLESFVGPPPKSQVPAQQHDRPTVLCVPADDIADHIAASMASHVLADNQITSLTLPRKLTTEQLHQRVAQHDPAILVITAVPPMAAVYAQRQCRALRERFPEIPIIVGLWRADPPPTATVQRLHENGATRVISRFEHLVTAIERQQSGAPPSLPPDSLRPSEEWRASL